MRDGVAGFLPFGGTVLRGAAGRLSEGPQRD